MPEAPRTWHKLTIQCPTEQAETVAAFLAACSDGGVEQGYNEPGEYRPQEEISVYLAPDERLPGHLRAIHDFLDQLRQQQPTIPIPQPRSEIITDCDWNAAWKKEFKPLAVVPGLVIKPSWEAYSAGPDEQVIEMDPGQAFGTGHHASTRLALGLLKSLYQEARSSPTTVLDVGCGTGILAMAAARWGAQRITAIDNDPLAVEATRHNSVSNHLQQIIQPGLTPLAELSDPFQLVLANITTDVLLAMATDLARLLRPGGHLILAGILVGPQETAITKRFHELGLKLRQQPREDEWVSFLWRQDPAGELPG